MSVPTSQKISELVSFRFRNRGTTRFGLVRVDRARPRHGGPGGVEPATVRSVGCTQSAQNEGSGCRRATEGRLAGQGVGLRCIFRFSRVGERSRRRDGRSFRPGPAPSPAECEVSRSDDGTASTSGKENEKEKELRVCSVTWNMCGRKFPSNLEPMLAPLFGRGDDGDIVRGWSAADDDEDGIDTPCDILVVGVQEAPAMDGFVEGLLAALGGDDEFVHLAGCHSSPEDGYRWRYSFDESCCLL